MKYFMGYLLVALITTDCWMIHNTRNNGGVMVKEVAIASVYSPFLFPLILKGWIEQIGEIKL